MTTLLDPMRTCSFASLACCGFVVAASSVFIGCPKSERTSADPAASGSASTPASASAMASIAASASASAAPTPPPSGCTADTPFPIDKGARLDTSLTMTEFENGKLVGIGYATGDATPRVALIDGAGAVTQADVDASHTKSEWRQDAKMVRHVFRVTPLGMKGGKMRVGMDMLDAIPEKGTKSHLRCGPADVAPIVSDDGGAQFDDPTEEQVAALAATGETDAVVDYRDCRTFGTAERPFVVATQVKREATGDNHNLLVSWMLDDVVGKGWVESALLDRRTVKPKDGKYPSLDHFTYPVARDLGDAGVLLVSLDQGAMVFIKRGPKLERVGNATAMWPGGAAGIPALDYEDGQIYLVLGEWAKSDIFASSFASTAPPAKPQKLVLDDPTHTQQTTRDSASIDAAPDKSLVIGFVEGKSPKRQARMTLLGPDLKQRLPSIFDVSPPGVNVSRVEIVALATKGKFLAVYLDHAGVITGVPVTCNY